MGDNVINMTYKQLMNSRMYVYIDTLPWHSKPTCNIGLTREHNDVIFEIDPEYGELGRKATAAVMNSESNKLKDLIPLLVNLSGVSEEELNKRVKYMTETNLKTRTL